MMPSVTIAPAIAALETTEVFTREEKELIKAGNAIRLFSRFSSR